MTTLLLDLLPVLLFFTAYKFWGLMPATVVLIGAVLVLAAVNWWRTRSVNRLQLGVAAAVLVFGGATLLLDDPRYIMWKPTVVYWLLALVLAGSHWIGERPLIKRLLGDSIALPDGVWTRLSAIWVAAFALVGVANLWVAYRFDTDIWVNFKLAAAIGVPLVVALAQGLYLARHLEPSHD